MLIFISAVLISVSASADDVVVVVVVGDDDEVGMSSPAGEESLGVSSAVSD